MALLEKFKKYLKRGLKTWTRCNWPELSKYCGCCELSTGIYIRCVATVVVTTATIIFNCILLLSLIHARRRIRNADMSTLEELLEEATDSENDLNGIFMILDGVVAYFLLWSSVKFFYIVRNIWTIYAVYKKNRRSLKILLYIGVPFWIFDGCLSIIATILLKYLIKGMMFLNFMFEGYNLLAVHSKYKEISGKSRKVRDTGTGTPEIIRSYLGNETPPDTPNQPHCITCTCYDIHDDNNCCPRADPVASTPVAATPPATETLVARPVASNSNATKTKDTLNFKDNPIIYNQEILQGAHSVVDRQPTPTNDANIIRLPTERPQRPTTLAIRPFKLEEKTDLCDTPVIYDEGQFNLGISPIIERL